jgi:phage tail sheath gpL-like
VIASEPDPARPLNGLPLTGIGASNIEYRLSRSQQESLLYNGVTPLVPGVGESVQIIRAISTYTTNATGTADPAYLDITTIRTLDFVRLAIETREALRFPRSKLSAKTPDAVRAQIIDVLKQLEALEIVEFVTENLAGIICERDLQDANRLNCLIPADVVNGLHILANRIDLYL